MKFSSLLIAAFSGLIIPSAALEIRVSPEQPNGLKNALDQASKLLKTSGLPKEGIQIKLAAGDYFFSKRHVLGPEFKGTAESPIVIEAQGAVWFDGSREIDALSFKKVTDTAERARLSSQVVDKVRVTTITDKALLKRFRKSLMSNLVVDEQAYLPAVFPNEGYAYVDSDPITPEVSPPAILPGNEDYGVRAGTHPQREPGRRKGWRGSLSEPRGARVGFASYENEMAGTWEQWEKELARNNRRNRMTGFMEANWLLSSQGIHAASATDRCVHLSKALTYGWNWKQKDKPFRVFGMLCELDRPGEWHFDVISSRLFLYPPNPITANSSIRLSLATGFIELKETRHVSVLGLSARRIGDGSVYKISGSHNRVAGAIIRDSTANGIHLEGVNNEVKGCDLIDLKSHVELTGGKASSASIKTGGNLVENCHIYQKNVRHQKVKISIHGVGNIFRNNLVHNSIGQAVVVRGNDHLISLNEFFNIGFEEGDGGAVYSGGDLAGYGVRYQHNFFHHLMHVPGKVERSGIHLDDLQAGATCIGNIFYKSAGKGIHMNGGAGHVLRENIFLEGYRGAYNVGHNGKKNFLRQQEISADPKDPRRSSKEDYVGRVIRNLGEDGWNKEPWASRYPTFRKVMNNKGENGRLSPIECLVENNFYYKNRAQRSLWSRAVPEVMATVTITGDQTASPGQFRDYAQMDFQPVDDSLPKIPFDQIGLKLSEYRSEMPNKESYRTKIQEFFQGIGSMPGTTKRIDTSRLVEGGDRVAL